MDRYGQSLPWILKLFGSRANLWHWKRYQSQYVNDTSSFYTYLSDPRKGVLRNGNRVPQGYSDAFTLTSLGILADFAWSTLKLDSARLSRSADAVFHDEKNYVYGYGVQPGTVFSYCPEDPRGGDYPSPCWPGLTFSERLSQDMW